METKGSHSNLWTDLFINALLVLLSVIAGCWAMKWLSGVDVAKQSDIGAIVGFIVTVIGLTFIILFEIYKTRSRLESATGAISSSFDIYKSTVHDKDLAAAVENLCKACTGIPHIRKTHIQMLINENVPAFSVPFVEELKRIAVLTNVVEHAKEYVYACTYADPQYLKDFWIDPRESINGYYKAHGNAIRALPNRVKRIFIIPDNFGEDASSIHMKHMRQIIADHALRARMVLGKDVFLIKQHEAEVALQKRNHRFFQKSFFVCDNRVTSVGELQLMYSQGNHLEGLISFHCVDHPTALNLRDTFEVIVQAALEANFTLPRP